MQFRTEIEPLRGCKPINHDDTIVMLGSCFTDEIGSRLVNDGFDVSVNPMGALYNPCSIANVVERALELNYYSINDLVFHDGILHCLDFPSTYQDNNGDKLLEKINNQLAQLHDRLVKASVWIITFGTSRVYNLDGKFTVGNCHKLPAHRFTVTLMSVDQIVERWQPIVNGRRVIFTVSPIRHLSDGLHGNMLSKATLLQAVDRIDGCEYFPSFEIMIDDLRDYRFYAADMNHPSPVAVEYIYSKFSDSYFNKETIRLATVNRKKALYAAHRPILSK